MLNYYGNSKEEFKKIEYLVKKSDTYNRRLILKSIFIILLILSCAPNIIPYASKFKKIYIIFVLIFFILNIASMIFNKYEKLWIYSTSIALFCLSIALSLLIENQPATIFPAMLIIVALLFTDKLYPMTFISAVSSLAYIILIRDYKMPDTVIFDSYNILVMFIISVIMRYLIQRKNIVGMKLKIENQKLIEKLNYDAKYDVLTNLLNL